MFIILNTVDVSKEEMIVFKKEITLDFVIKNTVVDFKMESRKCVCSSSYQNCIYGRL